MVESTFEEAFSKEWIKANIDNPIQELVIIRQIIPWAKIVKRLSQFYDKDKGPIGKPLRMMMALLIVARFYNLSDRKVIKQAQENRYIQYFCNIPEKGLRRFLHPSSLRVFRKRLGEKGAGIIEEEVFNKLRQVGIIRADKALIDSTVLESNIIYPNDVQLIHKAFIKMRAFAQSHNIALWWDDDFIKRLWREFGRDKNRKMNRKKWLIQFNQLFVPALKVFRSKVTMLDTTKKRLNKVSKCLELLTLLQQQTQLKLAGERHIPNRIVSLDEIDARPIKKGKSYPEWEFGTTSQMAFNREGFMIVTDNFIGNPEDKTLYPGTLQHFIKRTTEVPGTVVTDLGFRSQKNLKNTPKEVKHLFMGRSTDVDEQMREFCQKARAATEGFIAVAKNLRGFGRSLYRGFEGDRVWSLLCQTAYNLKKFLQLYFAEKLEDKSLIQLGL